MPLSQVYNIDCMEYMATVPDGYFDIAIVDPPYGLPSKSTQGSGKLKGRCLNRGNIQQWDVRPSEEYFRLADERFRRECMGETKLNNGQTLIQGSLF